ncbi:MAG: hypothetical protein QM780_06410 [Hyphomicrobium sp.]|uniref:hypothetical protein n=1 Tax=Hyphomicrobium sp. TaxID=82 RepID=UPI0039E63459
MTFVEQSCRHHAGEVWRSCADLGERRHEIFSYILRYCDVSGGEPTSSASIAFLRCVASASAEAYRRKSPAVSELKVSLAREPRLIGRKFSEFYAKAEAEVRLHQDVCSKLFKLPYERAR